MHAVLEVEAAWGRLNSVEARYAHELAMASWEGAKIVLLQVRARKMCVRAAARATGCTHAQTSPEASGIFLLFQRLFGRVCAWGGRG